MRYFIYFICDDTGIPIYIGKTSIPHRRLYLHKSKNTSNSIRIKNWVANSDKVNMLVFYSCEDNSFANYIEMLLVHLTNNNSHKLLNEVYPPYLKYMSIAEKIYDHMKLCCNSIDNTFEKTGVKYSNHSFVKINTTPKRFKIFKSNNWVNGLEEECINKNIELKAEKI